MQLFLARNDSPYGKVGAMIIHTDGADRCIAIANQVEQADWYVWAIDGHNHNEGVILELPRGHKLPVRQR